MSKIYKQSNTQYNTMSYEISMNDVKKRTLASEDVEIEELKKQAEKFLNCFTYSDKNIQYNIEDTNLLKLKNIKHDKKLDLTEIDLKILLQNFYKLDSNEQQNLISHLRSLEHDNPEFIEYLKKFVCVSSPQLEDSDSSEEELQILNALDDILEQTEVNLTDSESDNDDLLIEICRKKSKETELSKLDPKTDEPSKKVKNMEQFLKEYIQNRKKANVGTVETKETVDIQINANKEDLSHQISPELTGKKIKRKERRKYKKKLKKLKALSSCNANDNSFYDYLSNNCGPSANTINGNETVEPTLIDNMWAWSFGYQSYNEMRSYLQKTGIYSLGNPYMSFSDIS